MKGQANEKDPQSINNDRKSNEGNAEMAPSAPPRDSIVSSSSDTSIGGHFPSNDQLMKFAEEGETTTGSNSMAATATVTPQPEKVKLPQAFAVKYLGKREARGLWGIKYTRKPVDEMVNVAKSMKAGTTLPFLQFQVGMKGVTVTEMPQNSNKNFEAGFYPVDIISYGVQDLIYTRVFSMIVVREANIASSSIASGTAIPFECYAYVCDSRQSARRLTIALATAFQEFSKTAKSQKMKPKRVAIDLRTPEEMAAEMEDQETEA